MNIQKEKRKREEKKGRGERGVGIPFSLFQAKLFPGFLWHPSFLFLLAFVKWPHDLPFACQNVLCLSTKCWSHGTLEISSQLTREIG